MRPDQLQIDLAYVRKVVAVAVALVEVVLATEAINYSRKFKLIA